MKNYPNKDINNLLVNETSSIEFTLKKIQKNGYGTAFIINDKKKIIRYHDRW